MMLNPKADAGAPPLTKDPLGERLGGWKGDQLGTGGRGPGAPDPPAEGWLARIPEPNRLPRGRGWGQGVAAIPEGAERRGRDLPLVGPPVAWLGPRGRSPVRTET